MEILNNLVKELIPFAFDNNLDFVKILQTIDIILCNSELDTNNQEDVNCYLDTLIALNNLLFMFKVNQSWDESYQKVFDNPSLELCKQKVTSIPRLKTRRLEGYRTFEKEIYDTAMSFVESLK